MGSRADAAFASSFRRFLFSGSGPRVVALVAAMVFAVHLLSMHSGHHGGADHDIAEPVAESPAPSAVHVDGSDQESGHHDHGDSMVGDAGAVSDVDVLEVEHPHGEYECGEITQSRLGVAVSTLTPALGCLWVTPRPAALIRSQGPADLPRSTPHLVRELGVQRV